MTSASFALVVTALTLSILGWGCGIAALSSAQWYQIGSSDGNTKIGAFKICHPVLSGTSGTTTTDECQFLSEKGFGFSQCDRSAGKVSQRFSVVQGLMIAGVILGFVASAVLVAATIHGCRKPSPSATRRQAPAAHPTKSAAGSDGSRPASPPNNNQRVPLQHHHHNSTNTPMPIVEHASLLILFVTFVLVCAGSLYHVSIVKSWLFCDQKPCTFLTTKEGVTNCAEDFGWAFAVALVSWIATLGGALCMFIRLFIVRCCAEKQVPSPSDSQTEPTSVGTNDRAAMHFNQQVMMTNMQRQQQFEYQQQQQNQNQNQNSSALRQLSQPAATATTAAPNNNNNSDAGRSPSPQAAQPQQRQPLPAANTTHTNSNTNNGRVKKEGEPDAVLPDGEWEWDNDSNLFWSEEKQYFFDHMSGHFYDPDSQQWFNPDTNEWYTI